MHTSVVGWAVQKTREDRGETFFPLSSRSSSDLGLPLPFDLTHLAARGQPTLRSVGQSVCFCPTNNALPIEFLLSSDAENFVTKHRLSIQIGAKCAKKRVCNMYMFRLSFHFAYHRCCLGWAGPGFGPWAIGFFSSLSAPSGKTEGGILDSSFLRKWLEGEGEGEGEGEEEEPTNHLFLPLPQTVTLKENEKEREKRKTSPRFPLYIFPAKMEV